MCIRDRRIAQRELDETCAQLREAGISLSYEPPVPGALAALAKPELCLLYTSRCV